MRSKLAIATAFAVILVGAPVAVSVSPAYGQVYRPSTPTYSDESRGNLADALDRFGKAMERRSERRARERDRNACLTRDDVFESVRCARHLDTLGRYEREAFIRSLPEG